MTVVTVVTVDGHKFVTVVTVVVTVVTVDGHNGHKFVTVDGLSGHKLSC